MARIKITNAQMTALELQGVLDAPLDDESILLEALDGNRLVVSEAVAALVCDLSNHADEMARLSSVRDQQAKCADHDARVLSNLYSSICCALYDAE